jgi:hypothetical protein
LPIRWPQPMRTARTLGRTAGMSGSEGGSDPDIPSCCAEGVTCMPRGGERRSVFSRTYGGVVVLAGAASFCS